MHKISRKIQGGICRGDGDMSCLVSEFGAMALNGLFCADVLRPLDLVRLTDFTYKYQPGKIVHLICELLRVTNPASTASGLQ